MSIFMQLSQEQSIQYATTIQNLQIAVERMQREEAASFAEKIANLNSQLEAMTIDAGTYKALSDELQVLDYSSFSHLPCQIVVVASFGIIKRFYVSVCLLLLLKISI